MRRTGISLNLTDTTRLNQKIFDFLCQFLLVFYDEYVHISFKIKILATTKETYLQNREGYNFVKKTNC